MPQDSITNGDTVDVHYTGRLDDGEVFDSSAGGDPLTFEVGGGQVIAGFDGAVRGLGVGESRTVASNRPMPTASDALNSSDASTPTRHRRDSTPVTP
jgi:FKBP-type peptidyl-prolyl cis-trans isomerase (trigger factor)